MTLTMEETTKLIAQAVTLNITPAPTSDREGLIVVAAWNEALNGRVTYDQARQGLIAASLKQRRGWMSPGEIVAGWNQAKREARQAALPPAETTRLAHCGLVTCLCTHDGQCQFGWIDGDDNQATVPCRACRGDLSARVAQVPPPGERNNRDLAMMRGTKGDE
jgi:hypothetical protein